LDLFFKYGGYQVLRAVLSKQALGFLALGFIEFVRILTFIAIPVVAGSQQ
jgi:hypothetical protein